MAPSALTTTTVPRRPAGRSPHHRVRVKRATRVCNQLEWAPRHHGASAEDIPFGRYGTYLGKWSPSIRALLGSSPEPSSNKADE